MRKETINGVDFTVIESDDPIFEEPNYEIRSDLMIRIEKKIIELGLTQEQAAGKMGVNQPRVSNLVNGDIDKFTIDSLVNMLSKLGERIHIISEVEKSQFETVLSGSASPVYADKPWDSFLPIRSFKRQMKDVASTQEILNDHPIAA